MIRLLLACLALSLPLAAAASDPAPAPPATPPPASPAPATAVPAPGTAGTATSPDPAAPLPPPTAPAVPAPLPAPVPPAEGAVATPPTAPPPPGSSPPPLGAHVAGEEIVVTPGQEVLEARAKVFQKLVDEGYRRRIRKKDRTVFLSEEPWQPRVIVHDDGWIYFRREPPRIHAPGRSYTDQGTPAAYLLCVIAPTSCISIGGLLVSERKMGWVKAEVMDGTRTSVREMNDAVARRELGHRLNEDIPADLDRIWKRADLPVADRHLLLYEYWDDRTDTPEGDAAKGAIRAFLMGVVQQSDTPFTPAELEGFNAHRVSLHALELFRAPTE